MDGSWGTFKWRTQWTIPIPPCALGWEIPISPCTLGWADRDCFGPYNIYQLSCFPCFTRGLLGCLLGFWLLGQDPSGQWLSWLPCLPCPITPCEPVKPRGHRADVFFQQLCFRSNEEISCPFTSYLATRISDPPLSSFVHHCIPEELGVYGRIADFKPEIESCTQYEERLSQCFLANDIEDAKKRELFYSA